MAPSKKEKTKNDLDEVIFRYGVHHEALNEAITGDRQTARARGLNARTLQQDLGVLTNKWEAVVTCFYAFKVARNEDNPDDAAELDDYKTKYVGLRTDFTTAKLKTYPILDLLNVPDEPSPGAENQPVLQPVLQPVDQPVLPPVLPPVLQPVIQPIIQPVFQSGEDFSEGGVAPLHKQKSQAKINAIWCSSQPELWRLL